MKENAVVEISVEARMVKLESALQSLQDREAIRDVIHRYCRSADRCDIDGFKACYWPDGFDDHGFFGGNAWEFCDYVIPVLKQIDSSIHAITNTIIDIDGDRAFCESQWSVVHRLREDAELLDFWHQGRYLDIFEKRNGEWRILVRTIVSDTDRLIKTKDFRMIMAAAAAQSPDAGRGAENTALVGARAPHDPVFKGKAIKDLVKDRPGMPDLWGPYFALSKIL
jgi:hypothetical protein